MGLQNMITAFGGMIVQSIINSFGVIFIAGFTAANKLYGLLESAASSYGYGIASFAGQNKGAGLYQRIHQGFKEASALGIMTAYLMSAVMFFFGKSIMRCFVTGATETIEKMLIIGYEFLVILAIFFPFVYSDRVEHSARRFRADLPPFQSNLSALLSTPFRKSNAYLSGDECNDRFSIPPESLFRAL